MKSLSCDCCSSCSGKQEDSRSFWKRVEGGRRVTPSNCTVRSPASIATGCDEEEGSAAPIVLPLPLPLPLPLALDLDLGVFPFISSHHTAPRIEKKHRAFFGVCVLERCAQLNNDNSSDHLLCSPEAVHFHC